MINLAACNDGGKSGHCVKSELRSSRQLDSEALLVIIIIFMIIFMIIFIIIFMTIFMIIFIKMIKMIMTLTTFILTIWISHL